MLGTIHYLLGQFGEGLKVMKTYYHALGALNISFY